MPTGAPFAWQQRSFLGCEEQRDRFRQTHKEVAGGLSAFRGRVLTFGRGVRAVGGDLPHARAVAAQRHQPGDDGGLAEADVAHDDDAAVDAGVGALQLRVDLVEHPVPAHEHRLGGDAGDLEQQRLQGDVGGSVGCEADWKETGGKDVKAKRQFGNGCLQHKK